MALLKTLTFTPAPTSIYSNPKLLRRQKLIQRLEEQLKLAKDPNYSPTIKRWKKAPDGSKALVEVHRRMKRWWRMDANGNVVCLGPLKLSHSCFASGRFFDGSEAVFGRGVSGSFAAGRG